MKQITINYLEEKRMIEIISPYNEQFITAIKKLDGKYNKAWYVSVDKANQVIDLIKKTYQISEIEADLNKVSIKNQLLWEKEFELKEKMQKLDKESTEYQQLKAIRKENKQLIKACEQEIAELHQKEFEELINK